MANVTNGNTVYVDSTGTLLSKPARLHYLILTATAANAVVVLQDTTGSSTKLDYRNATSGTSVILDCSTAPIFFPTGIKVSTLTNALVTVVYGA